MGIIKGKYLHFLNEYLISFLIMKSLQFLKSEKFFNCVISFSVKISLNKTLDLSRIISIANFSFLIGQNNVLKVSKSEIYFPSLYNFLSLWEKVKYGILNILHAFIPILQFNFSISS